MVPQVRHCGDVPLSGLFRERGLVLFSMCTFGPLGVSINPSRRCLGYYAAIASITRPSQSVRVVTSSLNAFTVTVCSLYRIRIRIV